jgi:hypothetical protein
MVLLLNRGQEEVATLAVSRNERALVDARSLEQRKGENCE